MFNTECELVKALNIPEEVMSNIENDLPMTIIPPEIKEKLEKAAHLLSEGEVVAIPTETVYGLAGNALDKDVVPKIFKAKNRPSDNPLIVHVSSLDMLKSLLPQGEIPPSYLSVIRKFWPGPLTIILPKSSLIPDVVTGGHSTMAVRFPKHPLARALISLCGFPLAAPSANSSGKPSPTLASHVYHDLAGKIPLILDGGACNLGVESTVLDGLRHPPAILRPGSVTYEQLRQIPGMEKVQVYRKDFVDKNLEQAPTTPGMKYRHYSPDAEVILIEYPEDEEISISMTIPTGSMTHGLDSNGVIKVNEEEEEEENDGRIKMNKEDEVKKQQQQQQQKRKAAHDYQRQIIEREMNLLKEHGKKKFGILHSQSFASFTKNIKNESPSCGGGDGSLENGLASSTLTYVVQQNEKCIENQNGDIEYFMGNAEAPQEIAHELFKALRFVDKLGVDEIFIEGIPDTDEGLAVMNRIRKASSIIIKN